MKDFKKFKNKKTAYIALIIAVIVGGWSVMARGSDDYSFDTQVIERSDVVQIVSETGIVESSDAISLSFARSGRVANVNVKKGQSVYKGQVLARLESGSLDAELRQAQAALALELSAIQKTQLTFNNTGTSLADVLRNLYVVADDVVQAKVDQLFENPESNSPSFGIGIASGSATYYIGASLDEARIINYKRSDVEGMLRNLDESLGDTPRTNDATRQLVPEMEATLQEVQKLLTLIASSLNNYVADDTAVQTIYESYKADISSARTTISTALTTLRNAVQDYDTAEASVVVRGEQSGSVELQEIRIEDAEARIDGIRAQINDGYIVSSIAGIVTEVYVYTGEVASAATPVVSVISAGALEISVNIPEDDVEFVTIGDRATVSFDAYDNSSFDARVVYVSPHATIVDGITVFEVVLEFRDEDKRIKSGLSVDVDITTEERKGVIAVPRRAVVEVAGENVVRVLVSVNMYEERPVELGLKGDGGMVEIVNGLSEGDNIITFVGEKVLDKLTKVE